MKALVDNFTLQEIRFCNQVREREREGGKLPFVHIMCLFFLFYCLSSSSSHQYSKGGHRIEAEIGKYLEKNKVIKKFGYSFTCNGPRMEVEKWIMRNIDLRKTIIITYKMTSSLLLITERQRRFYDSR